MGHQDYQWKHEACIYGWTDGAQHYFKGDRTQATVIEDKRIDINKLKKDEMRELLRDIFSDKVSTTVIDENKPAKNGDHPTMKPLKLLARLTLHNAGRLHEIKNQPPESFETSNGPMAKAIRKGLADGSISPDVDVREIYYNSYDAILGIMQRLSIGGTPSARELDYDSRMLHLSQLFVRALSGK